MLDEQVYYVSLDDKNVSEQPMQGEATLEIIGKPEDIEKIKEYMLKMKMKLWEKNMKKI